MQKLLFLVCTLGLSCTCFSQVSPTSITPIPANEASWTKLSALHSGQKIQILDTSSTKLSGNFASVSETAIAYHQNADQKFVQRQDVRTIKLMENRHRLRNTLILAAVGAGIGAGIGAAAHKGCSSTSFCLDIGGKALPAAIGAVTGGLGGAVVGALLPSHDTIYNAGPH